MTLAFAPRVKLPTHQAALRVLHLHLHRIANMCGRYVLAMRPSQVRQHLVDHGLPVDDAPDDDSERLRQTYNFAPGYHGLIYRANTSDRGAETHEEAADADEDAEDGEPSPKKKTKLSHTPSQAPVDGRATRETKYKLQAGRWGLIPFWTKRAPDYASQLKTINCRDDSLLENRGMWNTMKQRKRCIVVAEGFYEWLKKNDGKEKIPHFTKRKDGQLMCFAGLWDMVQYEDTDEKIYTYTIITTDSNKQLSFLHNRMPVIFEPGSDSMKAWLDPHNPGWSKELQSMLKPFAGELECYPVDKAVGKVGNNSPSFVIPIDSKENKKNIANFFNAQRATAQDATAKKEAAQKEDKIIEKTAVKRDADENRGTTSKVETTEANAPLPTPEDGSKEDISQLIRKDSEELGDTDIINAADEVVERGIKRELAEIDDEELAQAADSPQKKAIKVETPSPKKKPPSKKPVSSQKTRSATSNNSVAKTPTKPNAKITSFFGK